MMFFVLLAAVAAIGIVRTISEVTRDGYGTIAPPRSHRAELPNPHQLSWS